ncbi:MULTISPECIES: ABC transporter permease [Rathayibacter]|uniref:ABC transporter permease n=1 Tax=Rathayibacter festucae DSM 15932 TaxID=1328866 RepID=A0A3Q9UVQ0_9MICO|nr:MULTISPECIES: ABC transporter permease [Rathayibacter]AZZ50977.1 ABC transporter permease [Rathayibacter festucae DSM 15932]MCJ1672708.1 ABC transporter permease [Rathayibacter sp. VKM Ac-2929]MCJ1682187.1 ABC transporter permease [Rathayibacter sp. VKM Ac-2928]MCJ1685870.1 ABC transporter permease [Rathayibacter sp. VKM Ac-2927]MCJ1704757.1 ABC transporter permease [Rathayibacter sp. VKM Ac-2926]
MTTAVSRAPGTASRVAVRSWKAPIAFGIFSLLAVILFVALGRDGTSSFRLASGNDFFALPDLPFPTRATGVVVAVVLVGLTAVAVAFTRSARRLPLWLSALFALVFLVGFLVWASAGATLPLPGLLLGTVGLATPLIFGSLGGVISERVGVVNVAIEGQLLAGAFTAAMVGSLTRQPVLGLLAAMIASVLVSFVLAAFAIKYLVDQVIVGVVLNVLVTGLTSFLYSQVLTSDAAVFNSPVKFDRLPIPGLSQVPILGPVLFNQTIIVYLMYFAIFAVWWGLFKTKWGLRLRAVGEHPQAADTVGINVARTRFWNVSLAGAIAGMGGAYYTLDAVGAFGKEMTAGAGFIALAAVIFGRWDPIKATLASLLFGFATNLQNVLGVIGSPVPSEFMLMLPYVVTIFAVAGLVGQSRGPAAAGKPYLKS